MDNLEPVGAGRWAAIRTVSRNPLLARCLRGQFAFSITEQGCWLAILLFAFKRGGVSEVGWVAAMLLVPAAALAPLVAWASDGVPRHRVLAAGFGLVASTGIGTGVAMLVEAPVQVTYGFAIAFSVLLTFAPPAVGAIIPLAATTADELTAANTATGISETAGNLLGPLVAGAILAVGSPGAVLVWLGALMGLGALSTIGRGVVASASSVRHADDPIRSSALLELSAGLRLLRRDPQVRALTGAIATTSWIIGALDVGVAAIAIDILQRDDAAVSVLLSGFGAGGLIGSAVSFALIGRRRLAVALAASVVVMCGFFAIIGWSTHLVTSTLLLVFVGAGVTLTSVAGRTMLQGLTPDDTLARLFGVLETLKSAGLALGGITLSVLAVTTSLHTSFAIVGATGIVGLAVMWRRLASIDRDRRPIDARLLQLARSSTVLSPLPPYAIEQVMPGLAEETFQPGDTLMKLGEIGDRIGLLGRGSVDVRTANGKIVRQNAGVLLGEIALLRDVPRTADVIAGEDGATVHWMNVEAFLDAVSRIPRSRARVDAEVDRRLEG